VKSHMKEHEWNNAIHPQNPKNLQGIILTHDSPQFFQAYLPLPQLQQWFTSSMKPLN